jgi:toxin-antitoxin system PIN domain toxin
MADRSLLDTNILVYALYESSPHHHAARAVLAQAEKPGAEYCLAAQSLAEFYAVVTDPRRVTPARDYASALEAVDAILALPGIMLLPTPADIVLRWMELIRRRPVTRQHVFDVQLVANMLGNGVHKILTFNVADFSPFSDIEAVHP